MENQKIKEQIIKANHSKLKFISLIALGFSVFALITDFLVPGVWHDDVLSFYIILDITFAIISVSAVSFFWLFKIKNINLQNTGIILFPFLVIIWSALITSIDFTMFGFSTFIIVILLATFFLYLNPFVSILFFVSSGLVIAATVYFIGDKNEHLLSLIFILFPTIVISVLLSARNYKNKINDLFNQKKILEMNMKLNDSNENLEKEVEKRTQQIHIALKNTEESEKKFRSYIENAPDGVFIVDSTGHYIEVNKALCSMLGYTEDEIKNLFTYDLVAKESLEEGAAHFKEIIESGKATSDILYKHKNGSTRWLAINTVKLSETRCLGFASDITERKQIEEGLKKSQLLLKASLESQKNTILLSIDTEYRYLFFNTAHSDGVKAAYNKDIKIGTNTLEYITSDAVRIETKANFDLALRGKSNSHIQQYGDVNPSWLESFYNPLYNDQQDIIGATCLGMNITERKQAEQAILAKVDELERFFKITVGREITMVELKKEVNNLLKKLGEDPKYKIVE